VYNNGFRKNMQGKLQHPLAEQLKSSTTHALKTVTVNHFFTKQQSPSHSLVWLFGHQHLLLRQMNWWAEPPFTLFIEYLPFCGLTCSQGMHCWRLIHTEHKSITIKQALYTHTMALWRTRKTKLSRLQTVTISSKHSRHATHKYSKIVKCLASNRQVL